MKSRFTYLLDLFIKTKIRVKNNPNVPCMISGLEVSASSLQTVQGGSRSMLGVEG